LVGRGVGLGVGKKVGSKVGVVLGSNVGPKVKEGETVGEKVIVGERETLGAKVGDWPLNFSIRIISKNTQYPFILK